MITITAKSDGGGMELSATVKVDDISATSDQLEFLVSEIKKMIENGIIGNTSAFDDVL